jgi:FKBP-type peptidyl-prolyl cis-trans isomerase FkpA
VGSLNIRLNLDGLEDRFQPSVTPDMVFTALVHTQAVADELSGIREHLNDPKTAQALSFLPSHLTERAQSSQADFSTLATYLHDLQTHGGSNEWMGTIASAELQASINAGYAELYAVGYGAAPLLPPPPPPSVDNGVNFGNTGNLPFSLTDPSWQTIANNVRIWDVTQGSGTAVATGDHITAKYTGYLTNGTIFDSSDKSGNLSTTLDSSHLIPGFAAGMVGMKPGATRRIDIPADQAYGANPPSGSGIPANSELVFEVTLISSP